MLVTGNALIDDIPWTPVDGHYALKLEAENYVYSATLVRIDEDLLEGRWQENSGGMLNNGTWSIELAE